jgi:hypothetical protein
MVVEIPYPQKNLRKNLDLAWSFFVQRAVALDWRGLQRGTNMLSTEARTAIVGKGGEISGGQAAPP